MEIVTVAGIGHRHLLHNLYRFPLPVGRRSLYRTLQTQTVRVTSSGEISPGGWKAAFSQHAVFGGVKRSRSILESSSGDNS
ncbi:hypothetical protein DMENIID0001_028460 [Sergentomyia squamirostris]